MKQKAPFDITTTMRVTQLYDEWQVNELLKNGWVLLAAGFESGEEGSAPCYILGTTTEKDPDDDFTRFLQEREHE